MNLTTFHNRAGFDLKNANLLLLILLLNNKWSINNRKIAKFERASWIMTKHI